MPQERLRHIRSRREALQRQQRQRRKRPKIRRWDIINFLIKKYGYQRYLEIGVRRNACFDRVIAPIKHGVDPYCDTTYKMTSDEFFETIEGNYDIIFVDGWHSEKQVDLDIIGALTRLNENGVIVLHDTEPLKESAAQDEPPGPVVLGVYGGEGGWHGSVWRSFIKLRCTKPNLYMCVIRCDCGIGIIKPGHQITYTKAPLEECLTWKYFDKHRIELLNAYPPEKMAEVL